MSDSSRSFSLFTRSYAVNFRVLSILISSLASYLMLKPRSPSSTWNDEIPFGDPKTFEQNIAQAGFYVYTSPVSAQSQADRAARKAPPMQIAGKLAGAVHTANVVVNIQP